ncbi:SI1L3 protein, partial [Brachypodius atriceps]|nr:SI1L3 protein [Brachypodius atriceps]
MGVRARVAEWPPRPHPKNPEKPRNLPESQHPLKKKRPPAHPDPSEFRDSRGFPGMRQRSSSEVTLSECDAEETPEIRGNSAGLFREYGSTSSIDVQGIPEQSFFEMLNEFRAKKPEFPAKKAEFLPGKPEFPGGKGENQGKNEAKEKPRRRGGARSDESILKKLRNPKDPEDPRAAEAGKSWIWRKGFAHFDVQSLFFEAVSAGSSGSRRRNTATGASAASAGSDPAFSSTEDLNSKENLELDLGDDTSNELLLSCPHFRNEIGGGRGERDVSFSRSGVPGAPGFLAECGNFGKPSNAGVSVLEFPKERPRDPERFSVEHVDLGARYYRDYFHGK